MNISDVRNSLINKNIDVAFYETQKNIKNTRNSENSKTNEKNLQKIVRNISILNENQMESSIKINTSQEELNLDNIKIHKKFQRVFNLIKTSRSKMKLSLLSGEEKFEKKMKTFKSLSSYFDSKILMKKINVLNKNLSTKSLKKNSEELLIEDIDNNSSSENNHIRLNFILNLAKYRLKKKKNTDFCLPPLHQGLTTYLNEKTSRDNFGFDKNEDFYANLGKKFNSNFFNKENETPFYNKYFKNIEKKNENLNKKEKEKILEDISSKLLNNVYFDEYKKSAKRIRSLVSKASKNIYNIRVREIEESHNNNIKKDNKKQNQEKKTSDKKGNIKFKKKSVFFTDDDKFLEKNKIVSSKVIESNKLIESNNNIFLTEENQPKTHSNKHIKINTINENLTNNKINFNLNSKSKKEKTGSLKKFFNLMKNLEKEKKTFDSEKIIFSREIELLQNETKNMYDYILPKPKILEGIKIIEKKELFKDFKKSDLFKFAKF